jgi:2-methylcitrate dehydratase PrpD
VEIDLANGQTLKARCQHPRGSYENPLSRAQVEDKFRTYAKARLGSARTEEVIAAVGSLENLASTRKLMDLLRAGAGAQNERAA